MKYNIIKKFVKQRMNFLGIEEDISSMDTYILDGLPESNVVSIIESYYDSAVQNLRNQGIDSETIFKSIDAHRSSFDPYPNPKPFPVNPTLSEYIYYRLEFELPNINQLKIDDNFNREKYIHFQNEYQELPSNPNMIETWYFSDWKVKKMNTEKNTVILTKRKFNGILQGFLGYSDKKGKNVSTLIAERLHISAFFGLTSLFLGYLVCIPLGIMKALKHGQKFDVISSIIVFVGYSIPGYALGVLLLSYFGGDVFPLHGWRSANFSELSLLGKIKDQLHHAFLPIICYMVGSFATMTVLMKNSLMENLSQDYVRTAFAKGLSEKRVIFFHAVRNSLIPLATGIGSAIGVVLAGSYLIEKTFGIDGIGLLGFYALIDKDYNIMMGFLVIGVIIRLVGNLISDLTYALIDPRIRFK